MILDEASLTVEMTKVGCQGIDPIYVSSCWVGLLQKTV